MGLLEELINKRANAYELRGTFIEKRDELVRAVETQDELIADLDRAIAALTPAQPSQSEEAKPDALAEFMKRERAVKWMGGDCPFPIGTYVVMLHRDGTEQGRYITHSDDYSGDYAWGRSDFGHREDDIVAFIDPQLATTKQQKGDDSEPLGCFEPGSGDGEESDGVAIPEGFTAHDGGACPVEGSTRVDVILASGARGFHQQNRFADSLAWERDYIGDRIIAYRVLPSEPAAEEAMVRAIATETCIACGGNINLDVSDDERDPDMGLGEDGWQCGDCTRKYIGGGSGAGPDTITIAASEQHAEESARAQAVDTWIEADAFVYPKEKARIAARWSDGFCTELLYAGYTDTTHEPRWITEKRGDATVTHLLVMPENALLPPEPPPAATPEQLEATGVIDGEAGWWGRKLMKERA